MKGYRQIGAAIIANLRILRCDIPVTMPAAQSAE